MHHFTPPGADLPSENGFVMSQSCADGSLPVLTDSPAPSAPNWLIEQFGPADADGTYGGLSLADVIHDFGPAAVEDEDASDMTVRERFGYGRPFDPRREWGTY